MFRFKDCEDDCGRSAEEMVAKEQERAEQFKRDQLLPIVGMVLPCRKVGVRPLASSLAQSKGPDPALLGPKTLVCFDVWELTFVAPPDVKV